MSVNGTTLEVPPAAKEGRSGLQSGLWQAVHECVYEFTP